MVVEDKMESLLPIISVKKKRKYGKLSLEQKVQIIRAAELGYSQRTLASKFNCGKTQIHLLVTQKDMWLSKWERSRRGEAFKWKGSPSTVSDVNNLVWDFYKKASSNDISITSSMLLERASQVSSSLHCTDFFANHAWLENFMREFNIQLPEEDDDADRLHQNQNVNHEGETVLQYGDYLGNDINFFAVVELYYRSVPCAVSKNNERITVCVRFSASGNKEIENIVFTENACIESELWNVSVPCFSSPRGQVTVEIYQHTLDMLNEKMCQENRNILLFVNSTQFPIDADKTMSNIVLKAWEHEEHFQRIVDQFKLLYTRRLLTYLAATSSDNVNVDHFTHTLPMWKVMRMMQSAWNQIPSESVRSSFYQTSSISQSGTRSAVATNNELLGDIVTLVKQIRNVEEGGSIIDHDYTIAVSEEILSHDECLPNNEEQVFIEERNDDDVVPLTPSDALLTFPRLETLLQSMFDSPERQEALKLLDKLECTVEKLLIQNKTADLESDICVQ